MLAEGLSYKDALLLIETLKNAGIEANLSMGAVKIYVEAESEKAREAQKICEDAGAFCHRGNMSTLAGNLLLAYAEKAGKKIRL